MGATALTNKLFFVKDGARVNFDFCMLGLLSKDQDGEGPAKKRTGIMTNSPMLAEKLKQVQCSKEHRHVMLMNGRARKCQTYPDEFCRLVCKTVMRENN